MAVEQLQWRIGIPLIVSIGLVFGTRTTVNATPTTSAPTAAFTAESYRIQGLTYRKQGRFDEAIASLQTAVELDPDSVSGQVLLGWTQHLAAQEADATDTLITALQTDPFEVQVSNALGIVHLVQGHLYRAILTHLWAAHLKPDNEIAYFNLSLATQRIGYHEWAVDLAARAVELEPYNPHPLIAKAIAHWSQGDRQQAKQDYQKALSLSPRYGTAQLPTYLQAAAFNSEQIQIAQSILND